MTNVTWKAGFEQQEFRGWLSGISEISRDPKSLRRVRTRKTAWAEPVRLVGVAREADVGGVASAGVAGGS